MGNRNTAGMAAFGIFLIFLAMSIKTGEAQETAPVVTPVYGKSRLSQLGLSVEATRMGHMGGAIPPLSTARREPALAVEDWPRPGHLGAIIRKFYSLFGLDDKKASEALNQPLVLIGADLYRLNCQSCHGPDGNGSPPEIKPVLGPVQGASPVLVQRRMEERGRPIDKAFAEELAADAEKALRERLIKGGEKMPAFRHLEGEEVGALFSYLKWLVGAPASETPDLRVVQSVARVGEHLGKGTCHICHDATGPGGGHMMMMRGTIPSLASFPKQKSMGEVAAKVLRGASGMMAMMHRSRMPVFPYLMEEEVVASYLYLAAYPPR